MVKKKQKSTKVIDRFAGDSFLIHGPPKIGKTSFAGTFPEPVLWLAPETGYKYLSDRIRKSQHGNKLVSLEHDSGWVDFIKITKGLKDHNPYSTIVVDTAFMLYELCKRELCRPYKIDSPFDRHDQGGLWSKIGDTFLKWLGYLATANTHGKSRLVMICHSKEEEIDTDTEQGVKKISVMLTGQARGIILARPDHVWYLGYAGGDETGSIKDFKRERCLWVQGTNVIYAETRDNMLSRKAQCVDPLSEHKGYEQVLKLYSRRRKA